MPYVYNPFISNLDDSGNGAGSGDVTGPASSTDNAVAVWDGTGGDTLQDSGVLITGAGNNDISANSISLTVSLPVGDGGTGASTLTGVLTGNGTSAVTANAVTQYGVLVGGASNAVASTAVGTSGDVLTSNGAGVAPTFQTPTVGTVTSVSGTTNRISSTGGATPVIDIDAAYVGQTSITTLGTVATGTWEGTTVAVNQGGTGQTSYTNGQLLVGNTTGNTLDKATLTGGTGITITNGGGSITIDADNNGTVTSVSGTTNRISSSGGATPVIDIDAAYVGQTSITTLGTVGTGTWEATDVGAAHGGTGRSSHTAYAVVCGGTTTTAAQQSIASVGTSGQVLTSNGAGALPTFQAAGGGGGGITWNSVSGTTQTAAVDNGYVLLNNSLTTVTLPTTAAVGEVVRVTGTGTGYFKVDYGTSVIIHFVDTGTDTTVTTGSLTATDRYASLELICVVADVRWNVISCVGNFTVA